MFTLPSALHETTALYAEGDGLPVQLVRAMVMTESNGDVYAWNPEPRYRYLVNARTGAPFRPLTRAEQESEIPPDDFPAHPNVLCDRDAEWWGQQASWGPLQVMGAVAREYGFDRHFPALCDPVAGVRYGCMHLARLRARFLEHHGWHGVVAAYNAGSPRYGDGGRLVNEDYVLKVANYGGFQGVIE